MSLGSTGNAFRFFIMFISIAVLLIWCGCGGRVFPQSEGNKGIRLKSMVTGNDFWGLLEVIRKGLLLFLQLVVKTREGRRVRAGVWTGVWQLFQVLAYLLLTCRTGHILCQYLDHKQEYLCSSVYTEMTDIGIDLQSLLEDALEEICSKHSETKSGSMCVFWQWALQA